MILIWAKRCDGGRPRELPALTLPEEGYGDHDPAAGGCTCIAAEKDENEDDVGPESDR